MTAFRTHALVQIFTAASKKGNAARYAFLASWGDVVIDAGVGGALGVTSVVQAKVVAIQAGLLWLISNPQKLKGMKMKLWSDSQSVLQLIVSLKPTSKLVEDTIELLVSAKLRCRVELVWVHGHSGVTGNEVVDSSIPRLSSDGEGIKKN